MRYESGAALVNWENEFEATYIAAFPLKYRASALFGSSSTQWLSITRAWSSFSCRQISQAKVSGHDRIILHGLVGLFEQRNCTVEFAGIEVAQGQQDLGAIKMRVEFECLVKFGDRPRVGAQHIESQSKIGMGFGRTRIELDDLLIDLFRTIELLVAERGFSLRRKFSETLRLRTRRRYKAHAAKKQQSNG